MARREFIPVWKIITYFTILSLLSPPIQPIAASYISTHLHTASDIIHSSSTQFQSEAVSVWELVEPSHDLMSDETLVPGTVVDRDLQEVFQQSPPLVSVYAQRVSDVLRTSDPANALYDLDETSARIYTTGIAHQTQPGCLVVTLDGAVIDPSDVTVRFLPEGFNINAQLLLSVSSDPTANCTSGNWHNHAFNHTLWNPPRIWRDLHWPSNKALPSEVRAVRIRLARVSGLVSSIRVDGGEYRPSIHDDQVGGEPSCPPQACDTSDTARNAQGSVGRPINPRTGNYTYSHTDISLPGRSFELQFNRVYSAYRTRWSDTVLGHGWTHNYNARLIFSNDPEGEPGKVIYQASNGSRFHFSDYGNGSFVSPPTFVADLTRDGSPGGYSYKLTFNDLTQYTFDNEGRLIVIGRVSAQPDEWNPLYLTYDMGGNLFRVSEGQPPYERYLEFLYDSSNRMIEVYDHRRASDPNSPGTMFTYDAEGNLRTVTDLRDEVWTYDYEPSTHRLTRVTNPAGDIVEEQDYDAQGRVIEQRNGEGEVIVQLGYSSAPNITVTDGEGNTQVFVHNNQNALTRVDYMVDGALIPATRSYDGNFRSAGRTDLRGNTSSFAWSSDGQQLTSFTDPLQNTTTFAYDAYNTLTQVIDARNNSTQFEYNDVRFPTLPTAAVNALNNRTEYTYTPEGFLESIVDAHSVLTCNYYDDFGQLIKVVQNSTITCTAGNQTYDPDFPRAIAYQMFTNIST